MSSMKTDSIEGEQFLRDIRDTIIISRANISSIKEELKQIERRSKKNIRELSALL